MPFLFGERGKMLNLTFAGENINYTVSFKKINENIVEIIGDIPPKVTGFILTRIGNPYAFKGDYSDFKTIYREVEGGFQFSNDGSVYVAPLPKVFFDTNEGGTLEGELLQEVTRYEDLEIPTPKAEENHVFIDWMPSIPLSGDIVGNETFTAIFTSTQPEPGETQTIEERVTTLENDVQMINEALGGA